MGVKRTRKDTAEKDGNPGQTEGQEGIQEFDDKEKTERSAAEAEDGGNDKPQDEVKENKVKGNKRTKKDAGDAKSNEPKDKKSGKENKKTSENETKETKAKPASKSKPKQEDKPEPKNQIQAEFPPECLNDEENQTKKLTRGLVGEEKIIFEYMLLKNRPFNALNVHDNLAGSIKKPLIIKILDKLTDSNKLQAKDFSKNKIYLVNQSLLPIGDEDEVRRLDEEIKTASEESEALKKTLKTLQIEAKEAENFLSLEEILSTLSEKAKALSSVTQEIELLKQAGSISVKEKTEIENSLKSIQSNEKKRIKIFNDFISSLSDILEEPKLKVKQLIGLED